MSTVEVASNADYELAQEREEREPEGEQHDPQCDAERERPQQTVALEPAGDRFFSVALITSFVVPQLAWWAFLGYLAHRLFS